MIYRFIVKGILNDNTEPLCSSRFKFKVKRHIKEYCKEIDCTYNDIIFNYEDDKMKQCCILATNNHSNVVSVIGYLNKYYSKDTTWNYYCKKKEEN